MKNKIKSKYPLKFYIPAEDRLIVKTLNNLGHDVTRIKTIAHDVTVFLGGEDLHPILYGDTIHKTTCYSLDRDRRDIDLFKSDDFMMPRLGICRGAQFLNVMSGGRLWQDVNNHTGTHKIKAFGSKDESKLIEVTSTHHQMMIPGNEANILAVAKESTRRSTGTKTINSDVNDYVDVEAAFYWNTSSLCCQFHPEYVNFDNFDESPMIEYFNDLVDEWLGSGIYAQRENAERLRLEREGKKA